MRNLIIFLRRYFNFFLFLLLEVICIIFILRNNNFQHTAYLNSANAISGKLYTQYNDVQYYFHLKATNDSLVAENTRLHNELRDSFDFKDTTNTIKTDTIKTYSEDSTHKLITSQPRRWLYREAKVIRASVNQEVNYITIHRGRNQGIQPNMGVIGPSGVVGMVRSVSDNYAVILSFLSKLKAEKSFGISARLKNGGETGTVYWDAHDIEEGIMEDVPKSAKLKRGDTVLTSGYGSFPKDIMVGIVDTFYIADKSKTSISIRLRYATNFSNLQHVYVIENLLEAEQLKLEDSTKKVIK
ncbi:rod shape-determining protein MreC [Chitinophaga skermanii]|uniref:Cell shape-determining protein MreC n=1 Tax=Chitinophaga skermanii TaxID=331697 RepID=A0A327QHN4_9BACT|nr:rod shape-determining protein MreC [Chitinophaga skermanii]RAJ04126.1 rod shape-determining protein MreC [Chitinophaga skermanii]